MWTRKRTRWKFASMMFVQVTFRCKMFSHFVHAPCCLSSTVLLTRSSSTPPRTSSWIIHLWFEFSFYLTLPLLWGIKQISVLIWMNPLCFFFFSSGPSEPKVPGLIFLSQSWPEPNTLFSAFVFSQLQHSFHPTWCSSSLQGVAVNPGPESHAWSAAYFIWQWFYGGQSSSHNSLH